MNLPAAITIDRSARRPLAQQIHAAIAEAIRDGRLAGGARLPSWRDLAAQLGVARGTVRVAYERLVDEQLVVSAGAAGTHVAAQPMQAAPAQPAEAWLALAEGHDLAPDFDRTPLPFQMGVPAQDAFPAKLWSRLATRAARASAAGPVGYPDPRGHPELRREIAAHLAIARGVRCAPAQVIVTAGYSGALGLAIHTLGLAGKAAWMEEPGFPLTRKALTLAGLKPVAVPVDAEGIDVAAGIGRAPDAAMAVVTPGQQAPLGMTLSLPRRMALLDWAARTGAWIVEDDYLSELQLRGRAAPALAALDQRARVLHAGTFAKTISPGLRLGFLVVPPDRAALFADAAACLAPAPAPAMQRAVAAFMAEGHYLRHLRRMKRLYAARRDALSACLHRMAPRLPIAPGGFAVRLTLPAGSDDVGLLRRALAVGLSPVPLSPWYTTPDPPPGLLLGVTNLGERRLEAECAKLLDLLRGV